MQARNILYAKAVSFHCEVTWFVQLKLCLVHMLTFILSIMHYFSAIQRSCSFKTIAATLANPLLLTSSLANKTEKNLLTNTRKTWRTIVVNDLIARLLLPAVLKEIWFCVWCGVKSGLPTVHFIFLQSMTSVALRMVTLQIDFLQWMTCGGKRKQAEDEKSP